MNEADSRALYEFTKSYVPARGVAAVNNVALALVGQPADKIDEGISTMLRIFVESLADQQNPPSQTFIDGIVAVCNAMI